MTKTLHGPILPPRSSPPQVFKGAGSAVILRDLVQLQTWLAMGALLQLVAVAALPLRWACLPATLYLGISLIELGLTWAGLKKNDHLDGIIPERSSINLPTSDGEYPSSPGCASASDLCVFIIGAQSNSPFGILDPVFGQMGKYMAGMLAQLDRENREETGFLGASSWISSSRSKANAVQLTMYFRHSDDVKRFAHGPLHKEATAWYYESTTPRERLGIFHETYQVPAGAYDSLYIGMKPTGANSLWVPSLDGQVRSSMVHANGAFATHEKRLPLQRGY